MDETNAQELEAGDDSSQEVIEEIEEGNLLALTIAELQDREIPSM